MSGYYTAAPGERPSDEQTAPLDYGTIRAQRLRAADVCSVAGCQAPVVSRYGREHFDGAGWSFHVTTRLCACHDAGFREQRIVIERT